jgi:hypothetical protein
MSRAIPETLDTARGEGTESGDEVQETRKSERVRAQRHEKKRRDFKNQGEREERGDNISQIMS